MDSTSSATAPAAAVSLSASSFSIRTTGTRSSSHERGISSAAQPSGGSLPCTQSCPKLLPHLPSSATITPRAPARCAARTLMLYRACFGSWRMGRGKNGTGARQKRLRDAFELAAQQE